jgi:hypothetical protein
MSLLFPVARNFPEVEGLESRGESLRLKPTCTVAAVDGRAVSVILVLKFAEIGPISRKRVR